MSYQKKSKSLTFINSTKLLGNIELHDQIAFKKFILFSFGFITLSCTPLWYIAAPGIAMNAARCLWDLYQIEGKELTYILYILSICLVAKTLGSKSLFYFNHIE